jgi:hypothetical protein
VPVSIFTGHFSGGGTQYAVSSDGQRFLMLVDQPASSSPITLILNWKPKP